MTDYTIPKEYLMPAFIKVSNQRILISTVLGSCVSVCLFDPVKKIGGMNHYILPMWNGKEVASAKYGDNAISELINKLSALGAKKTDLVAKIYGGSSIHKNDVFEVGGKNVTIAEAMLEKHGIGIKSKEVRGHMGRHIQFDTHTGEVFLRYVS